MAAEGGREGSRTKATWQKERMKEEGKTIQRIHCSYIQKKGEQFNTREKGKNIGWKGHQVNEIGNQRKKNLNNMSL